MATATLVGDNCNQQYKAHVRFKHKSVSYEVYHDLSVSLHTTGVATVRYPVVFDISYEAVARSILRVAGLPAKNSLIEEIAEAVAEVYPETITFEN
jgi:hypothetical protein